jgi:hypothetical protein
MTRSALLCFSFLFTAALHAQEPAAKTAFTLRAPEAKKVELRGQWSKEPIALSKGEKGELERGARHRPDRGVGV